MAPKRRLASASPAPQAQPASTSSSTPTPAKATPSPMSTTSNSAAASLIPNSQTQEIVVGIWQRYLRHTPKRTLQLDAFMAFLVIVGGVQFVYCMLAGNYWFLRIRRTIRSHRELENANEPPGRERREGYVYVQNCLEADEWRSTIEWIVE
ncbi:oligosaccharyl transferase complex subunit OST4 [[Emmonsia] crescens]|uniref:Oligosaccharyl transferase complex subunit OST4 n=1 Tax=[Emmonsia] crescens TaxID=73230 RepID=A0A0G2HQ20_9EURO|nr:oligosaccharyl transferase complex subunit OST4 [Emmonsia crescens UAMH 3008]